MEKIIVKPREVRGLGNIVSPKTTAELLRYNTSISSSSDSTYGTVYTGAYRTGSYLTVFTGDRYIERDGTGFNISVLLRNIDGDDVISSGRVKCVVNDSTTLTVNTDSEGIASFTVPFVDNVCEYQLVFSYNGTNSVAGCFLGYRVLTELSDVSFDLVTDLPSLDSTDTSHFVASMKGNDCNSNPNGVPGQVIYFYEEYVEDIRLFATHEKFNSGDSESLYAQLIDSDEGSRRAESGVTVYFFEDIT